MEQAVLLAEPRDLHKGGTNALRRAGKIPAILYGQQQEVLGLTLDAKSFAQTIAKRGEKVIFALQMSGEKYDALLREVQTDPVSDKFIHLDFYRVDMNKEIETDVPLVFIGVAAGIILGGVMDIQMRSVRVRCMPLNLPEKVEVDVTPLSIGNALHVSDLVFPAGVAAAMDGGRAVVTVTVPTKEEEVKPAAGAEGEVPVEGAEGAVPAEGAEGAVAAEGAEAGAKAAPGAAPGKAAPGAAPAKGAPAGAKGAAPGKDAKKK